MYLNKLVLFILFAMFSCQFAFRLNPSLSIMKPLRSSMATFSPLESQEKKIYNGWTLYKGKAALCLKPILPKINESPQAKSVEREGALLFEFAPATNKPKEYDWTKKQYFSLSVVEIGEIIGLDRNGSAEFYHDPNKGSADEGKIGKKLQIKATPDGKGYFFSLMIKESTGAGGTLSLPVARAEFEVIRSISNFLLPRFLGFDLER